MREDMSRLEAEQDERAPTVQCPVCERHTAEVEARGWYCDADDCGSSGVLCLCSVPAYPGESECEVCAAMCHVCGESQWVVEHGDRMCAGCAEEADMQRSESERVCVCVEDLRALVAGWRRTADELRARHPQAARTYTRAADELEEWLPADGERRSA
jgi:hypothetical protein